MTTSDLLGEAIQKKDAKAVARLVADDPGLAERPLAVGMRPLTVAAYLRATPVVEALLAAGVAPTAHEAAILGDVDALDARLAEDASRLHVPSPDGWTPLHLAAHFGREQVARDLVARGADVHAVSKNAEANTPLHAAAAGAQPALVRLLVDKGADVDARAAGGHTALHVAAANGSEYVVKALLAAGTDPSARNDAGQTPRDVAVERGADEVVPLLTVDET